MRRLAGCATLLALIFAADAGAAAKRTTETLRLGIAAQVDGAGCAPAELAHAAPQGTVVSIAPGVGADVGDFTELRVTAAEAGRWSIAPTPEECQAHANDPQWGWSTGTRAWTVDHRTRVLALKAKRLGGLKSIAGFGVASRSPTLRRAKRRLGRPSAVRRDGDNLCRATWKRIGLMIGFANFGGGDPCRSGFAQYGRATGPRWAALVGPRPGVGAGTEREYLIVADVGTSDPALESGWALAEKPSPFSESGYTPAVTALFTRAGTVRGFKLWIGAAGD